MSIITEYLHISTQGNTDIIDITSSILEKLKTTKIKNGIVTIHVCGSTGALTTCEYEPGLIQDLKEFFDKLLPAGRYHHDERWHDGNGHSHLRASLIGPSITVPFTNHQLILGTWQQIIFIDFDNRKRERKLVLQFLGE